MKRLICFISLFSAILSAGSDNAFARKQGDALIDSLRNRLPGVKEDTDRVNLFESFAVAFLYKNPDSAMACIHRAQLLAEKIGYKTGVANAHSRIADILYNRGDYKQGLEEGQAALKIAEEIGNERSVALAYNAIANILSAQGNYPDALKYDYDMLKLAEKIGDKQLMGNAYTGIGNICLNQQNDSQALKKCLAGLDLYKEIDYKEGMAAEYNLIAMILGHQHKTREALEYYNLSLKINQETGNKIWAAYNYGNIGAAYSILQDYEEALKNYEKEIEIATQCKDKTGLADGYSGAATIYVKLGKYPIAEKYLSQALVFLQEAGDISVMRTTYEQLYMLDSLSGNWKSAYENHKQYILYRDSMVNQDNIQKEVKTRMLYEFGKKEAITKEEARQQRKIRNVTFAGTGVLLLFTLVVVRQRNKVRKGKQRSDELLLNILPSETAEELKTTGTAKAKDFESVTVMFTDFKNFSSLSKQMNAQQLVNEINYCYSAFDNIISKYGIEKIKTIGDSYMCAGGLPVPNKTHAEDAVRAALEIRDFMLSEKQRREAEGRLYFEIRIGIHTGPVVAGIVGIKKFAYDIWGDTVNIASRMESSDEAGKINISEATFKLVKDRFKCIHRGKIEAKNMGVIDMYFVERVL